MFRNGLEPWHLIVLFVLVFLIGVPVLITVLIVKAVQRKRSTPTQPGPGHFDGRQR